MSHTPAAARPRDHGILQAHARAQAARHGLRDNALDADAQRV